MRIVALLLLAISVTNCKPRTQQSEDKDFQNKNISGDELQIGDNELMLTLDDGPGAGTKKIVDFLKLRKIPATFFMIGVNMMLPENQTIIDEIAAEPLFMIGNHSMNHSRPLTASASWAISETREADRIINARLGKHQTLRLMRPPQGALAGSKTIIAALNAASDPFKGKLNKYIGPIFWDIGGENTATQSADWACWTDKRKKSVATCRTGYLNEVKKMKKGVILTHDITTKTAEMLVGDGVKTGLIDQLLAAGYKFVALDKAGPDYLLEKFGGANLPNSSPEEPRFDEASIIAQNDSSFTLKVGAKEASYLRIYVNGKLAQEGNGPTSTFTYKGDPGYYEVKVEGFAEKEEPAFISQTFVQTIGG